MRSVVLIATALACLAGCRVEAPESPVQPLLELPPLPPRPTFPNPPRRPEPQQQTRADRIKLLEELEAAQAYWTLHRPMMYELTVTINCWCLPPRYERVSRIVGDVVVRSTGEALYQDRESPLQTVEALFLEAREALNSDADRVAVTFDPAFKYPREIFVDHSNDAVDDEWKRLATLQVLQRSRAD